MNLNKIKMIKEWFKLKIYREVKVFLNFVNFYKRFIHRYFKIAASLTSLLKDNKDDKKSESFKWFNTAKQAFR